MHKLYKQSKDGLRYWEVWQDDRQLVVHYGLVGTQGETKTRRTIPLIPVEWQMDSLAKARQILGYSPMDEDDLDTLILQLRETGDLEADLNRRNQIMEDLDQLVGWIGAGQVDGADTGSGTMNIFISTVSAERTSPAIVEWLQTTPSAGEAVLAFEPADEDQPTQVLWPTDYTGPFEYF